MEKRYYIAYGSNLNIRQMRMRCPSARRIGTSELKGYELLFKGSKTGSYLTVEKKPGRSVPVGVWEVTQADEKALDRYEGFPNFYYKKELTLPSKASARVRFANAGYSSTLCTRTDPSAFRPFPICRPASRATMISALIGRGCWTLILNVGRNTDERK